MSVNVMACEIAALGTVAAVAGGFVNQPPPTGAIVQPDYTNKNTGRTQTATQAAMATRHENK